MATFQFDDPRYEYHIIQVGEEFGIRQTYYQDRGANNINGIPPAAGARVRDERKVFYYFTQYTNDRGEAFWHTATSPGGNTGYITVTWASIADLKEFVKKQTPYVVEKLEKPVPRPQ